MVLSAAVRGVELSRVAEETATIFGEFGRALRTGTPEEVWAYGRQAFQAYRNLSVIDEFRISAAGVRTLESLALSDDHAPFVLGLHSSLIREGRSALSPIAAEPYVARLGPRPAPDPIPAWARRFFLSVEGRRPVEVGLDEKGEASLFWPLTRIGDVRFMPTLGRTRPQVRFDKGPFRLRYRETKRSALRQRTLFDGTVLEPWGVTFSLGPDAPPLERMRQRIFRARSLGEIREIAREAGETEAGQVQAFLEGRIPFDRLPGEGGLPEALDRLLAKMQEHLFSHLEGDEIWAIGQGEPGSYILPPPLLVERFRELADQFLPEGIGEETSFAAMDELNSEVLDAQDPQRLAESLRGSLMLGADLYAERIEGEFAKEGPVSLKEIPRAFGLAGRVAKYARDQGRLVLETKVRGIEAPPTGEESKELRRLGLSFSEFSGRAWMGEEVPDSLSHTLAFLKPAVRGTLTRKNLAALTVSIEGLADVRDWEKYVGDDEGEIDGDWMKELYKVLGADLGDKMTGASIVFGETAGIQAFDGRLYFSLAERSYLAGLRGFLEGFFQPFLLVKGLRVRVSVPARRNEVGLPGSTQVDILARDQEVVYEAVTRFHRKERRSLDDAIRPLTAPLADPQGNPLRGISFGQRPYLQSLGFLALRGGALRRAVDAVRLLLDRGHRVSWDEFVHIVASRFRTAGIDSASPAFARSLGSDRFEFLRARTLAPSAPPAPQPRRRARRV